MNICIICAKSNSKRVENKNFLKIRNKPIINFTIEAALESKIFDKIYVNTDKKNYDYDHKKVEIFSRPKFLTKNNIRVLDVIHHQIKNSNFENVKNIFVLFPTCPLRNSNDIKNTFKLLKKYNYKKQIVSVTEYIPSIDVAFQINNIGKLKNYDKKRYALSPGNNNHRKFYYCNYSVIASSINNLKKTKKLINEGSIPYIMPYLRSIDIDEKFQLQLIKKLIYEKKI